MEEMNDTVEKPKQNLETIERFCHFTTASLSYQSKYLI